MTLRHTTHSVGISWAGDQPDAQTSTLHTTLTQTSMPSAVFEPTIPASERPKNRPLHCAATRIGEVISIDCVNHEIRYPAWTTFKFLKVKAVSTHIYH
jgi:hypothetical protein